MSGIQGKMEIKRLKEDEQVKDKMKRQSWVFFLMKLA